MPAKTLHTNAIRVVLVLLIALTLNAKASAQQSAALNIQATLADTQISQQELEQQRPHQLDSSLVWWEPYVAQAYRSDAEPLQLSLHDVLYMALMTSEQIRVYGDTPLIRETAIAEAAATFDWVRFAETFWNDISEPVGNTLTIGGPGDRFLDQRWTASAGVRKRTFSGGEIDISQRLGWQDTNSNFFLPSNQATTQLSVGLTQPLARGRGLTYNRSLIVLAQLDTQSARDEYSRQLQTHLLEVIRGYWGLHLERASLVQRVKLYESTKKIYEEIQARATIDAQRTQLVSAAAALEARRTDLIRAQAAVKNAETRLRVLSNHPAMGTSDAVELVPVDPLLADYYRTDLSMEMSTAIQRRPEVSAALRDIHAASVRLNMSRNEVLPQLNLVTRAYVNGLEGDSRLGTALGNQFIDGRPSYSVGLVYELPAGNRAAGARLNRRRIEARQLQSQYQVTVETVRGEVDIALRELRASYDELTAKSRTLAAAVTQADTLQARWRHAPGANGTGTLTLESLLDAQQRITEAEASLVTSQLTYCLAISNLHRANGTLLTVQNIDMIRMHENCLPRNAAEKGLGIERVDVADDEKVYVTENTDIVSTPSTISRNRR